MLDITEIKKIIPHRYPMLLIDRVEELIPGEKAVAKRNVLSMKNYLMDIFLVIQ